MSRMNEHSFYCPVVMFHPALRLKRPVASRRASAKDERRPVVWLSRRVHIALLAGPGSACVPWGRRQMAESPRRPQRVWSACARSASREFVHQRTGRLRRPRGDGPESKQDYQSLAAIFSHAFHIIQACSTCHGPLFCMDSLTAYVWNMCFACPPHRQWPI